MCADKSTLSVFAVILLNYRVLKNILCCSAANIRLTNLKRKKYLVVNVLMHFSCFL